jgi:hypothetical protein
MRDLDRLKTIKEYLLLSFCACLVVGAWQIFWELGVGVLVLLVVVTIVRLFQQLDNALSAAIFREGDLSRRFLSALGWANTLGDEGHQSSYPYVSRDRANSCEHWWYRPDNVSDGYFGNMPHSDFQAVINFSLMTMTTVRKEGSFQGTFNWKLKWNDTDLFTPHLESHLVSRVRSDGVTEFVDSTSTDDWGAPDHDIPNGASEAYRVYLLHLAPPQRPLSTELQKLIDQVVTGKIAGGRPTC